MVGNLKLRLTRHDHAGLLDHGIDTLYDCVNCFPMVDLMDLREQDGLAGGDVGL